MWCQSSRRHRWQREGFDVAFLRGRWDSKVAAACCKGPVLQVLKTEYLAKCRRNVLEDNDTAGVKSSPSRNAKADSRTDVFEIPKQSLDLNVCDYALWQLVNVCVRAQARSWPATPKETHKEHLARLKCTALRLLGAFVSDAKNSKKRCKLLGKANVGSLGGLTFRPIDLAWEGVGWGVERGIGQLAALPGLGLSGKPAI